MLSLSASSMRMLQLSSRRSLVVASARLASTSTATSTGQAASDKASQAADSAKETAQAAKDKASEGVDAAKEYANKAVKSGSNVLDTIGQRTTGLLGAYSEPVIYNLQVLREFGKQVYISEKLAPPTNPQVIREAYQEFYHKASDASWWRNLVESGEWKRLAIYALEAYGLFKIGEMIGRRHVVGYKVDGAEEHHH